jgi:hypothetical protein
MPLRLASSNGALIMPSLSSSRQVTVSSTGSSMSSPTDTMRLRRIISLKEK